MAGRRGGEGVGLGAFRLLFDGEMVGGGGGVLGKLRLLFYDGVGGGVGRGGWAGNVQAVGIN